MKLLTGFLVAIAASLSLFSSVLLATDTTSKMATTTPHTTDRIVTISEPRYLETKSKKKRKKKKSKKKKSKKKKKTIAQIRNNAIKDTLGGLKELRPYTTNYNRLKSSVRSYWKRNVKHATAKGLSRTIMRHVKRKHKKLVRSEVYSGSKSGVKKVKKELKKRKG